jgi:hypothetical protein
MVNKHGRWFCQQLLTNMADICHTALSLSSLRGVLQGVDAWEHP